MNDVAVQRKQRSLTSENVKTDSPAARIVDKFGGLTRFCELCDFPHATAHSWMTRAGCIPNKRRDDMSYQAWIMARAVENGIVITPVDFLDL